MLKTRWLKRLVPVVLCLMLFLSSCASAPSKYDQVQKDTTGFRAPAAVDKKAEKGGTFNQFFPGEQGDYKVVPSQEKKGFAEYKLKRGDTTVAMLTINDTTSVPAAAEKYANATTTIAGYPAVEQGTTATGILVNGRYQVKVLSRDPSFTPADRAAWLQKFDLQGLAQLKGAAAKTKPLAPAATRPTAPGSSQPKASGQTSAPTGDEAKVTPAKKPTFKLPKLELPDLTPAPEPAA